jgi:branched-chain amino acid aminotransferase
MSFTHDRLEKELASTLKPLPALEGLTFGTVFTDHMVLASYDNGWKSLKIVPFQDISLPPQASVFHYSVSVFEGMKAFRDTSGQLRLFRPDRNWARFARSCKRVSLPAIDPVEAEQCLEELLRIESRWIPNQRGYSLYIRPTMIGITSSLGVKACSQALFFIILSPVGPYYRTGFKPVSLWACSEYVRAWPGGTGALKCGANYAISVMPGELAHEKGCQQVLWLQGKKRKITEVGAMNLMVVWINKDGERELFTASLDDGTVLPGVTRESILELAKEDGGLKVTEGIWTMPQLIEAIHDNRVLEIFGTGTAAVISPVNQILYEDEWFEIPIGGGPEDMIGYYGGKFLKQLQDIQYGVVEHPWSIVVK